MNALQIQNQILESSRGLPEDILNEILDFIQFLKIKRSGSMPNSVYTTLSDLNFSEASHLEEEFTDYKTVCPIE